MSLFLETSYLSIFNIFIRKGKYKINLLFIKLDYFQVKNYYIKTENKRNHPFVNRHENKTYDLQLNIFAYKK